LRRIRQIFDTLNSEEHVEGEGAGLEEQGRAWLAEPMPYWSTRQVFISRTIGR